MDVNIKLTAAVIERFFEELDWIQIGMPAESLYVAGRDLYATQPNTGKIFHYQYGSYPNQKWKLTAGAGTDFLIYDSELYRLSKDKSKVEVFRYVADPEKEFQGQWKFIKIRGKTDRIYSGPFGLFATDFDETAEKNQNTGLIYRYVGSPTNGTWKKVGNPGKMFAVGKHYLYGLSVNGKGVYRFDGNNWKALGKPNELPSLDTIYAGGDMLYATQHLEANRTADIFQYDATKNIWAKIGGPSKEFAVDEEGHLYRISPDNAPSEVRGVYTYFGGKRWSFIGNPGNDMQHIVAASNQLLYGIDSHNKNVWKFQPNGDLALVDWCYSLPGRGNIDEIKFNILVKNKSDFIWNPTFTIWDSEQLRWTNDKEGNYSTVFGYYDGKIHHELPKRDIFNPVGLAPGASQVIPGVKFPFDLNWQYYIGPATISHPKDRNETNDRFDPPTKWRGNGITGRYFMKGENAQISAKACPAN